MEYINKNYKIFFNFLFTLLFLTFVLILSDKTSEEVAAAEALSSSSTPQISYSITGDKSVGSTITMAVNVTNGENIYGGSLDLIFDSNLIQVTSAKMGTLFQKDLNAPLINDTKTPGKTSIVVTLSGANKKLSTTSGSLVIITAKVKSAGTIYFKTTDNSSSLNLKGCTSCIKLSDKYANKISYTATDTYLKLNEKSILSLSCDKPSNQLVGTPITITGTASPSNLVYRFQVFDGTYWKVIQDYSSKNSCVWIPQKSGTYRISLNVKDYNASDNDYIYKTIDNYIISEGNISISTLTTNRQSQQPIGTPITITGNTIGSSNVLYRFQVFDGSSWKIIQNYSNKNSCTWTPQKAGNYRIALNVKKTNAADSDYIYKTIDNYVICESSINILSFTSDKQSKQKVNTPITITGIATGVSNLLYRFQVFDGSSWKIIQDYSSKNSCVWTPQKPGTYRIALNVKRNNAKDSDYIYKTIDNYVIYKNDINITSLSINKKSGQIINTPITITGTATGDSNLLYRFQVFDGSSWKIIQNYSNKNSCVWTPQKAGIYRIALNVKLLGQPDTDYVYKTIDNYTIK